MCEHKEFHAKVNVIRFEDSGRFMAEITVRCSQCGEPFQFLGLEVGLHVDGARVSVDGLEANIAICPKSARPTPLQRMAAAVRGEGGGSLQ